MPKTPPEYFRLPILPPSTHHSSDLASSSASIATPAFQRSKSHVSSVPDSDAGSNWTTKPPTPNPFAQYHGNLSTRARDERSEVSDTSLKEPQRYTRKEIEEREKRRKAKELKERDIVHQIFASGDFDYEGKDRGPLKNGNGGGTKRGANKEKSGFAKFFELKAKCWHTPERNRVKKVEPVVEKKETEEERQKRDDEEDEVIIRKGVEEKLKRVFEKEEERRNKRLEERRFNAFMNEPLSHSFSYPWQYASHYPQPPVPAVQYSNPLQFSYEAPYQPYPTWLNPLPVEPNYIDSLFQDPQISEVDRLLNQLNVGGGNPFGATGGGTPDGLEGLSRLGGGGGGANRQAIEAKMSQVKAQINDLIGRIQRLEANGQKDGPIVKTAYNALVQLQNEFATLGNEKVRMRF